MQAAARGLQDEVEAKSKSMEDQEDLQPGMEQFLALNTDFRSCFAAVFDSEPDNATPEALAKWKELGALTLE